MSSTYQPLLHSEEDIDRSRSCLCDAQGLDESCLVSIDCIEADLKHLETTQPTRPQNCEIEITPFPMQTKIQNKECTAHTNTASNVSKICAPVTRGSTGFCYDIEQIPDEKLRARLQRNRNSAKKSRMRKLEAETATLDLIEKLEAENRVLLMTNGELCKQVWSLEMALRNLNHPGVLSQYNYLQGTMRGDDARRQPCSEQDLPQDGRAPAGTILTRPWLRGE